MEFIWWFYLFTCCQDLQSWRGQGGENPTFANIYQLTYILISSAVYYFHLQLGYLLPPCVSKGRLAGWMSSSTENEFLQPPGKTSQLEILVEVVFWLTCLGIVTHPVISMWGVSLEQGSWISTIAAPNQKESLLISGNTFAWHVEGPTFNSQDL